MKKFSPNLTDQELYDLFRNAAENYEPIHYREERNENWAHIIDRIGHEIPAVPKGKRKFYIWRRAFTLLILLFLALGLEDVSMRIMKEGQWKDYDMDEVINNKNSTDKINAVIKDDNIMNGENSIIKTEYTDRTRRKNLVLPETTSQNKHRKLKVGRERTDAGMVSMRRLYAGDKQQADAKLGIAASDLPVGDEGNHLRFNVRQLSIDSGNTAMCSTLYPCLLKSIPAPGMVDKSEKQQIGRNLEKAAAGHANRKPAIHHSKWSVAVTAGTDWSRVSSKMGRGAGIDYGLMIQHRFAPRWSIEAGLLLTSKLYSARPADYHSFANYPLLFRVNAECRVLDLPVNLKYDVIQKGENTGFVSSGISSIWMQKEDYYLQSKINGSIQTARHTFYNRNQHSLSILNIAIGYEHAWNKMALQVSPYLKLPLRGVGYGKVKLISSGVFISGKYNF